MVRITAGREGGNLPLPPPFKLLILLCKLITLRSYTDISESLNFVAVPPRHEIYSSFYVSFPTMGEEIATQKPVPPSLPSRRTHSSTKIYTPIGLDFCPPKHLAVLLQAGIGQGNHKKTKKFRWKTGNCPPALHQRYNKQLLLDWCQSGFTQQKCQKIFFLNFSGSYK